MASLRKIRITRYLDKNGRQVPKGTPGASKVKKKSAKWYAVWWESHDAAADRGDGTKERRKVRKLRSKPLSADKKAAQVMLAEHLKTLERQKAGLSDPSEQARKHQQHLRRPIGEHVEAYQQHLRLEGVSEEHFKERTRLLGKALGAVGAETLEGLTAERLNAFVAGLECSARTKETYRNAVVYFMNWLKRDGRVAENWLARATVPKGKRVRRRRALKPEEIKKVIAAARERPLKERMVVSRGPNKGKPLARLSDAYRAKLERSGRERALIYLMAVYTGLRRKEIAALRVYDLRLDDPPGPHILLPGDEAKNKEEAQILLVPAYAEELRRWVADTGKQQADKLFSVRKKMIRVFREDLAAAGVEYRDARGCCADFHSLRMTADTMLGLAGVQPRVRQLFMRHADIRLTMERYDDSALYELQDAVKALDALRLC